MRCKPSWGIKTRLFLFTWMVGILPLVVSSALSYLVTSQAITDRTRAGLQANARMAAKRIETFMDHRLRMARLWAATPVVISGSLEERFAYFNQILKIYPEHLWIGMTDPQGRIVTASDPRDIGQNASQTKWFRICENTHREMLCDVSLRHPRIRPALSARDVPHIGFAAPIFDPQGRFLGALRTQVKREILVERLQDLPLSQSGGVLLIGPRGEVVADLYGPIRPSKDNASSLNAYRLVRAGQTGIVQEADLSGKHSLISFAPLDGLRHSLGWSILVQEGTEEIFAPARAQLKLFGTILLLGTLFILAGGFFVLNRGIAAPVRQLMEGVWAVGRGNFGHRVKVQGQDELGKLAGAFNEMSATLEEKNKALQAKSEELESYIHAISHDLRSPVVSIEGFCRLLAKDHLAALGEKGKGYLDRIRGNVEQIENLIEGLLELSRAGRMSPAFTHELPQRILKGVQEELSYLLEQEKIRLIIHPDLPPIYCDRKGMRQVFTNLIQNAIAAVRGTPHSSIEVGYVGNGSGGHHFYVRDNGMGIDPSYASRIFEPFHSFFPQAGKEEGRTGLGLAIVKKIILAHGGEIWVESTPGKGASFHFTLPKADSPKAWTSSRPLPLQSVTAGGYLP
ncbi:MAG: sensor histidine kinase [Candidatus Tectomicrobia bacterium]|uniref:histidine kinase n=1 Tax=Tectimicrobiota bacterium TaxID=2528274 RepID=A0A932CN85_UNCTE|nr:sensor histidine kinase [Candidatus Tectomicrobia bacterium]